MKTLITACVAFTLTIASSVAAADGAPRYSPHQYNNMLYGYPAHGHRPQYPQYQYPNYYYHRDRRNKSNEVAWALGGLVLGAIIAGSANNAQAQSSQQSVTLPPPPKRKVQVCEDVVAYDENEKPYVLRRCVITER